MMFIMDEQDNKPKYQYLSVDCVKYKTLLTEKFKNRKVYVEKDPRQIMAFIPGTINKVYVKPGQKIKCGDRILTLEAMKMKNIINSPLDGIVKEVHVKQGKVVAKNELLVELN